jgi:hypothetical protein
MRFHFEFVQRLLHDPHGLTQLPATGPPESPRPIRYGSTIRGPLTLAKPVHWIAVKSVPLAVPVHWIGVESVPLALPVQSGRPAVRTSQVASCRVDTSRAALRTAEPARPIPTRSVPEDKSCQVRHTGTASGTQPSGRWHTTIRSVPPAEYKQRVASAAGCFLCR